MKRDDPVPAKTRARRSRLERLATGIIDRSAKPKAVIKPATKKKSKPSAVDEAKNFLEEELSKGPKPVKEVQKLAKEAGISSASLQRAKEELEIRSQKNGDSWSWALNFLAVKPNHLKGENHA
jgi:hypothetical protein